MVRWHVPSTKTHIDHWGQVPAGANDALCDEFFGNLDKAEERWWDNENYFCTTPSSSISSSQPPAHFSYLTWTRPLLPCYSTGISRARHRQNSSPNPPSRSRRSWQENIPHCDS